LFFWFWCFVDFVQSVSGLTMVGVNKAKQKYSFNDHHIPFSFSFHQKFTMCGLGLPWFYSSFCFVFVFFFRFDALDSF